MAKEFMSVPPWLEVFLSITTFFNECEEHSEHIRRECNLYCFDCNGDKPLCTYCVKSCYKDHRIIQIRSSYHDVVRVQDIEDELDTSGVQSYVINNFDVVFLNKRGFDVCRTKKNSKSCRNTLPCEICRRNISNAFHFCSLGCKNKYRFASTYDQSMARKIWNLTCMDRYSDSLAKARKKAKEKANSDNIQDLKGFGPRNIRTEMWAGLVDIWATEEWKKKFITGKVNRVVKPDAMMHTGGSRSFGQHLKKMEEEHKRPISYGELYNKVHKKKDGEYVSNKPKNFIESYENAMTEKYGEDTSNHPIVDSDIWIKTAGENKKGRIYGIGQSLDLGISHVSSSSVEGPSFQNLTTPLTEEITTLAT